MRMISLKYVNATQRNMIYYLATSSSNGAEVQSFIQSVFCRQSSFNNLKSLRLDCNNPRPSSTTSSKSLILNLGVLTPAEDWEIILPFGPMAHDKTEDCCPFGLN